MNRRAFLKLLGVGGAATAVDAPRRVYSFLWDNPLVRGATEEDMLILSQIHRQQPFFFFLARTPQYLQAAADAMSRQHDAAAQSAASGISWWLP